MLLFMSRLNNSKITSKAFNIFVMKMASPEMLSPDLGVGIKPEEEEWSRNHRPWMRVQRCPEAYSYSQP